MALQATDLSSTNVVSAKFLAKWMRPCPSRSTPSAPACQRQCMRRLTGTRIVLDHGEEIGLFVGWVPALAEISSKGPFPLRREVGFIGGVCVNLSSIQNLLRESAESEDKASQLRQ
jgi:hypothetical protein